MSERGGWPNLFVVGVARAGTSSIAAYIAPHPDVTMSSLKEPYSFTDDVIAHAPFHKDESAYLALFDGDPGARWRAEASTANFWDPASTARIAERCGEPRIVISLRSAPSRPSSAQSSRPGAGVRPPEARRPATSRRAGTWTR